VTDKHKGGDPHPMAPLSHPEPVRYPPGRDPVLDNPKDPEAAVDDFRRVLLYSLALAFVFVLASYVISF
jgi:hypothetical protein